MHAETKTFCVETIFLGHYSIENSCKQTCIMMIPIYSYLPESVATEVFVLLVEN